ncbi:MAG: glutamine--tRNA ligase, partial [Clostridia bacterium]|nr:glutamine--tRNA ligase [Clostridia bacterium]
TPSSIFEFVKKAGISKANSLVDIRLLEFCIRDELNREAKRKMAVLEPLKVVLTNFPEDEVKYVKVPDYPQNEETTYREVPLTRELYIERSDTALSRRSKSIPGNLKIHLRVHRCFRL